MKQNNMNEDEADAAIQKALRDHVAGNIIKHDSPFSSLLSHKNEAEVSHDFIQKWVRPFYMKIWRINSDCEAGLIRILPEISDHIISQCLGDFNWRTRETGALFSAITNKDKYLDIIGVHLLKSEFCYAGKVYADVMAYFNNGKSISYLETYLEYYLRRPDLEFNQIEVMTALGYVNKENGTSIQSSLMELWLNYCLIRKCNSEIKTEKIEIRMQTINRISSNNHDNQYK
jgi:Family of unknown function (DUF6000)